ncbi:hypothetical protein HN748_02045 [Candidatus Peregrinibacteria bacterium]|jgi:dihydrofolate synthase / folylpolyglutamate synthase|nr:hypothetical protein [Candidatus Peregrinibacteria bacterium]MBT7702990.1 hypothetical protein [Candidatus Peregrinibacteria bacterium]
MTEIKTGFERFLELPTFDRSRPAPGQDDFFDLSRFQRFLDQIGNPEKGLPVIHVAGSKGKGSTCVLIGGALQALGKRVGVFMSPYLREPTEAIFVDGAPMTKQTFDKLFEQYSKVIDDLAPANFVTSFEVLTAMALQHFHDEDVDFAIMETGLGGRLDATNAVESPILSIICPIEKEHTDILGNSITSIAYEKLGIVREDTPVVIAHQADSMILDFARTACMQKKAKPIVVPNRYEAAILERTTDNYSFRLTTPTRRIPRIKLALLGEHQIQNSMTAWAALDELLPEFDPGPVLDVFEHLTLPGRFEYRIQGGKEVILDGAHTPESAAALRKTLAEIYGGEPITFILAFLKDKDVTGFVRELCRYGDAVVLTQINHPRALPARIAQDQIKDMLRHQNITCAITNNLRIAWQKAGKLAGRSPICVTGSFKLIEAF